MVPASIHADRLGARTTVVVIVSAIGATLVGAALLAAFASRQPTLAFVTDDESDEWGEAKQTWSSRWGYSSAALLRQARSAPTSRSSR
jgi:hypothetical protein